MAKSVGVEMIRAERMRQIEQGLDASHDQTHNAYQLIAAARCYLRPPRERPPIVERPPIDWPWGRERWHANPDDRVRELVKAGALIAAEIDRLKEAS